MNAGKSGLLNIVSLKDEDSMIRIPGILGEKPEKYVSNQGMATDERERSACRW